jgi:stage II sporulation protein D
MHHPFHRFCAALLLSGSLIFASGLLRAREAGWVNTRPPYPARLPTGKVEEATTSAAHANASAQFKGEPLIRVGLATSAHTVNISTSGKLMASESPKGEATPLGATRVRVEPRAFQTPSATLPDEEGPHEFKDALTSPHRNTAVAVRESAQTDMVKRQTVERGTAVYAPGDGQQLLNLRTPVVFASHDEETDPIRYNEKPYRGRLEVFANSKGTLTVVNVVPLEDYVRGVVPNELSPGGWPELEALKAQALVSRTYAVSNLGRFAAEGYDLTPDTRSQVYGGRSTEHPLTDRAVAETRGRVITYKGAPINAIFTSTCGGRTEDGENIFGGAPVAYLRGRECALEAPHPFAPFTLRTSREPSAVKAAEHATSTRDAALLAVHGFQMPARLSDEWLASNAAAEELTILLAHVAELPHRTAPGASPKIVLPSGFASALAAALDGESRGSTLLNHADVEYLLAFSDADEVPQQNRADVAAMLREGHLALLPDGTLRPSQPMSRARVLRAVAHALEGRGLLRLQKAVARVGTNGALVLRPASGKDLTLAVSPDAFLFRAFGEGLFTTRELELVGGEPLTYHTKATGEVDYIEARPAESGAASDRASRYTQWAETLTPSGVLSRLSRSIPDIGSLVDLRVRQRGVSGRVLDLEVVGSAGTVHVRGGRVRSALGLREQLFVIDRAFDESGRVTRFTFTGRGWGHGVGMCQVGAYGLARAGLDYEKILLAYYTDVQFSKLY